jgi:hypothetical protein
MEFLIRYPRNKKGLLERPYNVSLNFFLVY